MFVASKVLDPNQTSDEQFNRFHHEEHFPNVVSFMKEEGFPLLELRYRNTNSEASRDYLALYPNPDVERAFSALQEIFLAGPRKSEILGGDILEYLAVEFLPYEKVPTFEGYGHADKSGEERHWYV